MGLTATARSIPGTLRQDVLIDGRHHLTTEAAEHVGGEGSAPAPHELFPAALAACVAMTLTIYARTKEWDLGEVTVAVDYDHESTPRRFDIDVQFTGRPRPRATCTADQGRGGVPSPAVDRERDRVRRAPRVSTLRTRWCRSMSTGHEKTTDAATLRRSGTAESLGLPARIRACLFDLDGVLTQTAQLHAAAWKETFDNFLRDRSVRTHEPFVPFDSGLRLRAIRRRQSAPRRRPGVPRRTRDRSRDAATVDELGERKNERVLELIRRRGLEPYEGSVRYVRAVRDAGLAPRGRLGQRELPRRPRSGGSDRPVRGADRRSARRGGAPPGEARSGHFSRCRARARCRAG